MRDENESMNFSRMDHKYLLTTNWHIARGLFEEGGQTSSLLMIQTFRWILWIKEINAGCSLLKWQAANKGAYQSQPIPWTKRGKKTCFHLPRQPQPFTLKCKKISKLPSRFTLIPNMNPHRPNSLTKHLLNKIILACCLWCALSIWVILCHLITWAQSPCAHWLQLMLLILFLWK